jgi:hypothetical protein
VAPDSAIGDIPALRAPIRGILPAEFPESDPDSAA